MPGQRLTFVFNSDKVRDFIARAAADQRSVAVLVEGVVLTTQPIKATGSMATGGLQVSVGVQSSDIADSIVATISRVRPWLTAPPTQSLPEIGQGSMSGAHFTVRGDHGGTSLELVVDPGDGTAGSTAPLIGDTALTPASPAEMTASSFDFAPKDGITSPFTTDESEFLGRILPNVQAVRVDFQDGTNAQAVVIPAPEGWNFGAWVALVPGQHHVTKLEVTTADGQLHTVDLPSTSAP